MSDDLTGKQFGFLTVLTGSENRKYERYWLCQCVCGIQREVSERTLKNGKSTHCGCKRKDVFKDMTGKRFGNLTVVKRIESHKNKVYWLLRCDCGKMTKATTSDLNNGDYSSCGCMRGKKSFKHGKVGTHIYYCWAGMKDRCSNPNFHQYHNYGGRGIKVCEEWLDFRNFDKWAMQNGYKVGLTIERVNVDGNYEPSNCTWIEKAEQPWNKTDTVRTIINGKEKNVRQIAEETGLSESTIRARISKYGWRGEEILQPSRKELIRVLVRGESLTIYELVDKYDLNLQTLRSRYQAGDRGERLIRTARKFNKKNSIGQLSLDI